ncbi:hypothetical protein [Streptomyces sp. NPDC089915]|uniref:hypothetical protein n=1 Tax=Streptomyces sp. NPDC089915 TaxID=3155186 RepID=UPI003449D95E
MDTPEDPHLHELWLLSGMDGRGPAPFVDAALARLGATHEEMEQATKRYQQLTDKRQGRLSAVLELLSGARIEGRRTRRGNLVVDRHRFASWPDFEYEVEYDPAGHGWFTEREEFVRAPGSTAPQGTPVPWAWLRDETLARYEVLREIDHWGLYHSFAVRDGAGEHLFLSFSSGLLQEVCLLEVLDGEPVERPGGGDAPSGGS